MKMNINTYRSESIVDNLFLELELLLSRIKIIKETYTNTSNNGLRLRLVQESQAIKERINQIFDAAEFISRKSREKISLSYLLVEKCKRINDEMSLKNLYFL